MTHLPIWYIGQAPLDECDRASAEILELPPFDATMGSSGERRAHAHRSTTVRFAPDKHWFGQRMFAFAQEANRQTEWNYELVGHEAWQHATYGVDQHYEWHVDNFPLTRGNIDRKVTVVCLLNDPSEFDGGEFQMRLYQEYVAPLGKGSVIAFPSILEHRVTPVTRGVRMSATMWLNGPRFR